MAAESHQSPRASSREVVVLARRQHEATVGPHSYSVDVGGKRNQRGGAEKHHTRTRHAQQSPVAVALRSAAQSPARWPRPGCRRPPAAGARRTPRRTPPHCPPHRTRRPAEPRGCRSTAARRASAPPHRAAGTGRRGWRHCPSGRPPCAPRCRRPAASAVRHRARCHRREARRREAGAERGRARRRHRAAGLQVANDGQESEGDERVARYKQQAAHLTARAQEHRTGHISS